MCSVSHFILTVLLFIALTPGVLVRFPRRGSLINAAVVHGILFAILSYLLYFGIQRMSEGFKEGGIAKKITTPTTIPPAPVISRGSISAIISPNTGKETFTTDIIEGASNSNDTLCDLLTAAASVQDTFSKAISDNYGTLQKNGSLTANTLSEKVDAFYTYLSEVKQLIIYLNQNKSSFPSNVSGTIPNFFSVLGDKNPPVEAELIIPKNSKVNSEVINKFLQSGTNYQQNFYNLLKGNDVASLKGFITKANLTCSK
jgi:hypothetical protein